MPYSAHRTAVPGSADAITPLPDGLDTRTAMAVGTAGFTAMLPAMAGAANRCVIPEHKFNIEQLTELVAGDVVPGRDRVGHVLNCSASST